MIKYLVVVFLAFAFIGCHKKDLDQCQVNLAEQEQVNSVLASKIKECIRADCLPNPDRQCPECVTKVPLTKDETCDYYKSLYSKALHQYRKELKECEGK